MATIPSIALIPSGYKANKLYSVLPTTGNGDFTFARTSIATRVNKSGLIEEVLTGIPRLDYSDGTCPSLLLEPTSTNFAVYSEAISTSYSPNNLTQTPNYGISPDGNLTSTRAVLNNLTDSRTSFNNTSLVNGTEYTFSAYYKGVIGQTTYMYFLSSAGGVNVSKEIVFNGQWQRESITFTAGSANNFTYIVDVRQGTSTATDFEVWGVQVEENSYATSYIKTVGTAQTRVADTVNGAGDTTLINSTEGTLYFEGNAFSSTGSSGLISLNVGTTDLNNRVTIELDGANVKARFSIGGTSLGIFNYATDITDFNKVCLKYKANDFALWVNGAERVPLTSGNSFSANTLSELDFNRGDGGEPFNGNTKDLRVYNTALSDLEIETLSSWTSFTAMANALNYTII